MNMNVIALVLLLTYTKHIGLASAYGTWTGGAHGAYSADGPSAGCPPTHQCTLYSRCVLGEVDPGSEALSSIHECRHPDYPNVPSVCCRTPQPISSAIIEAAESCPEDHVCIEGDSCQRDIEGAGLIKTPFPKLCFKDKANHVIGICCYRPAEMIDDCADESTCISEDKCQGEALKSPGVFLRYSKGGSWSKCVLGGDFTTRGVCCRNPVVITRAPPRPRVICGLRNNFLRFPSLTPKAKEKTGFGELPWQAILFFRNDTFQCGASLISYRWLVTTAQCVNGYQHSDFKVRVGDWQINSLIETLPHVDASIASITIHSGFNLMTLENNVAVIELTEALEHNRHINPVCLPTADEVLHPETRCIVSGWRREAFQEGRQEILNVVDLPFIDDFRCQGLLRQTRLGTQFILDPAFLCAGGEEGKDSCPGAGGAPLACLDPESNRYVLRGLAAWSISCDKKDIPAVFTDVTFFADWIRSVVGDSDNV